jgi:formylglycine-generating enzyme required for sulfatase activity
MKKMRAAGITASLLLVASLSTAARQLPAPGLECPAPKDDQLWVPGGRTIIGNDQGYAEERPAHEASVKGFWIDRHEVTNAQFARFVEATGYVTLAETRGDGIVFRPPGPGERPTQPQQWWRIVKGADWRHPEGPDSSLNGRNDYPVVQVAYADALAYARWAGRSLPSEEQFEYAARAGAANSWDQPAPREANSWQGTFPVRNDVEDGHAGLAPVGCYHANRFGLQDMIGNVWEWTESWYLPSHQPVLIGEGTPGNPSFDPGQPDARVRVIKGGSFLCAPNYCARYRPAARHAEDEQSGASHLGFRTVDVRRAGPV